jgi:hypothetical protein
LNIFVGTRFEELERRGTSRVIAAIGQGIQERDLPRGVELRQLSREELGEGRPAGRCAHLFQSRRAELLVLVTDQLHDQLDEFLLLRLGSFQSRQRTDLQNEQASRDQATAYGSQHHLTFSQQDSCEVPLCYDWRRAQANKPRVAASRTSRGCCSPDRDL